MSGTGQFAWSRTSRSCAWTPCCCWKQAGFEVKEFVAVEKAIAFLETKAPAVVFVFTDVHTPGRLDGVALAQVASDRWPWIKILITSGTVSCRDGASYSFRFDVSAQAVAPDRGLGARCNGTPAVEATTGICCTRALLHSKETPTSGAGVSGSGQYLDLTPQRPPGLPDTRHNRSSVHRILRHHITVRRDQLKG